MLFRSRRRLRVIAVSWHEILIGSPNEASLRPNDVDVLSAADFRADRYTALVRFVISLFLLLFFLVVVVSVGRINLWLAGVGIADVILAGCGVYVTRRKIFKRWFPWLICAADAVFLFSVGWFGPWLDILPAGFAFALISQWAVFLILSIEALRAQSNTILFQTVLICGLLSILTWWPSHANPPPAFGGFEQLFSGSSNLTRLTIILLSGLVLAAGARRSRAALKHAIVAVRERAALLRFHPKEINNEIASEDVENLLKGRRHKACILFADLRGFTSLSEDVEPDRVVRLLASFRTRSERVIHDHGGIIDKFIGDGFLAVFGLTGPTEQDATNSVNAALALLSEMDRWSRKRVSEKRRPISIGIGLHTGEVFVGVIGSERMEFTVIGDAVNVAQRLEAMTKEAGFSLIASEAVLLDAGIDPQSLKGCKLLQNLKLRGRSVNMNAYGGFPLAA